MDRIMSSWQGAHLDDVISEWGYPDREANIAGKHLYYWHYTKSAYIPAQTSGTVNRFGNSSYINAQTTGGHSIEGNCTRILEVDKSNIVIGWQWEGNNCPFAEAFEYSSWRRRAP